jgi:protein-tyrosine phosphatase
MTSRRCSLAWLSLGLLGGTGCGGDFPENHLGSAGDGARPALIADAGVDVDAAASTVVPDGPGPDDPTVAGEAAVDGSGGGANDGDPGSEPRPEADADRGATAGTDADEHETDATLATVDSAQPAVCGPSPWLRLDGVPNVRQLGTVPLANGRTIVCDQIYRGSSLASLTTDGCEQFVASRIRTVIDTRSTAEQASAPAECVTRQSKLISAPMPVPYNVSPTDYLAVLYTASSMRLVFAVLADATAYPVYYHCLYGKDRTGVLTAVILAALGASRESIQAEYALTGEAGFAFYPASLSAVLDEIDRIGGIDAYFKTVGVPEEHVQAMRKILLSPPDARSGG